MTDTIIAASWNNGLFVISGDTVSQELQEKAIRGLCAGRGGLLAIVDGHQLCSRSAQGHWDTLATSDSPLSCILATREAVLVGTDDAQLLRLTASGELQPLPGFRQVAGRERWYAGTAVIDGRVIGPPLGVRSLTATCDERAWFANVHVGGIPRSTDAGSSWHPTLEIDWDVHEVCAHPSRPQVLAAASGAGLCISVDGGASWSVTQEGLHAPYCAAVAFCGDDVLVCAANDHFADTSGLYRAPYTAPQQLAPVMIGESRWLGGIADTACLTTKGESVAVVGRAGQLHWSGDGGRNWRTHGRGLRMISTLLIT